MHFFLIYEKLQKWFFNIKYLPALWTHPHRVRGSLASLSTPRVRDLIAALCVL